MGQPVLSIENLHVEFHAKGAVARAVDGIELQIAPGEIMGLVGESGSGKTVTSLSILRLLPEPAARIVQGKILFKGNDILTLTPKAMRQLRGNQIAMVFQEPMTSLNPVFTVGDQLIQGILAHESVSRGEAARRAVELLAAVGIPDPSARLNAYPFQLSGGLRQRVMIALAVSSNPALLIADEPTTALDVTVQAQILNLLVDLQRKNGMSILLITHDLGVVAETCQRVAVMYAGEIVEIAPVEQIFRAPRHPYTQGLMACIPHPGARGQRLVPIAGRPPDLRKPPEGCRFAARCPKASAECRTMHPPLLTNAKGEGVRCLLWNEEPEFRS